VVGSLDIAIVGAGPAGLASALYLERLGHRPVVFERFEVARPVGSGLMIQPTGQAVLADLGLLPGLQSLGRRIDRLDGRDAASGRVVLDVRYDALPGGQHAVGVHRAVLFDLLHEAVLARGIEIRTRREVTGLDRLSRGRMLSFANGPPEGPFDLVVDASGGGSRLRSLAQRPAAVRPMRFGALWATVPWAGDFAHDALMQRYRGASIMAGVLPIGQRQAGGPALAAFFWSLPVESHAGLIERGFDSWRREVEGIWPACAVLLDRIDGFEALTLARYAHLTLPVPSGEGIAFVGDSAHATSPQLGQGANMALLDARALAIAIETSPDVPAALVRYGALRRWHVRLYQAMSLTLTPLYQSESRVLPVLRDILVARIGRVPPLPRLLAGLVAGDLLSPLGRLGLGDGRAKAPRIPPRGEPAA
jgi:2-polyprenyl-6-methoxyphenol hydroxylase-like FAD-dependent oxidoreductase